MDYKTTKRISLLCWPSLYYDEIAVLDHLFFVNGNGFEWKDGELVDRYYGHLKPRSMVRKIRKEHRERLLWELEQAEKEIKKHGVKDHIDFLKKELEVSTWSAKKQREYHKEVWDKLHKDFPIDGEQFIYPICEYAKIATIPDDVKPDWLDAATRAIEFAKDGKCGKLREEDKEWLDKAEKRVNDLRGGNAD